MATNPCTAAVRRDAGDINVRSAPSRLIKPPVTKLAAGTSDLRVLDVKPDEQGEKNAAGKIYLWFQVQLADGKTGWVRDDLIDLVGECSPFGYAELVSATHAISLMRTERPVKSDSDTKTLSTDEERVRKAAFNITTTFEGGGYSTYQTKDAGVISYGRFQFTLAAGKLPDVVDKYLESSSTSTAQQLRSVYRDRIKRRDVTLKDDETLKNLLKEAAAEQAMKDAQDWGATVSYWKDALERTSKRNLNTPLAKGLIFDMLIHHGAGNVDTRYLQWTNEALGLPATWRVGENGVNEQQYISRLAQRRRDELHRQAGTRMGGLKVRGDFWFALVERGDWQLQGDAKGELSPKSGRVVQVKNP